jgi:hypothetical protein
MNATLLPRHDFPQAKENPRSLWNRILNRKPEKSLAAKLAEVCDAVGGVGKNGRNSEDGYRYQKWADISSAVRGEMAKRDLVLIPQEAEILSEQRFETRTVKNGVLDAPLVELKIKRGYTVTDGRESIHGYGLGVGQDFRDKALYKAETGSLKYFLRGLFLIPDVEDDPEIAADRAQAELAEEVSKPSLTVEQAKALNEKNRHYIGERAIRSWNTLCHRHGKTVKQRREYLLQNFGVKTIAELETKLHYDRAIVWASNREDIKETLEASLEVAKAGPQPVAQLLDEEPEELAGDWRN